MTADASLPEQDTSPSPPPSSVGHLTAHGFLDRMLQVEQRGRWVWMRSTPRYEITRSVVLHCVRAGALHCLTLNMSRGGVAMVIMPGQSDGPIELEIEEEVLLEGFVEEPVASRIIARSDEFVRLGFIGTGRSTQQIARLIGELELAETLRQKAAEPDNSPLMGRRAAIGIILSVAMIGIGIGAWHFLQSAEPGRQRLADVVTDHQIVRDRPPITGRTGLTAVVLDRSNGVNLPAATADIPATLFRLPAGTTMSATLANGSRLDGSSPVLAEIDNDVSDPVEPSRILVPKGTHLAGRMAIGNAGVLGQTRIIWTSVTLPGGRALRFVRIGEDADPQESEAAPLVSSGIIGSHVTVLVQQPLALPRYRSSAS